MVTQIQALLHQMQQQAPPEAPAWLLTPSSGTVVNSLPAHLPPDFAVFISPTFSVLLQAWPLAGSHRADSTQCCLHLSFTPTEIQTFLADLANVADPASPLLETLQQLPPVIGPNAPEQQSAFTLALVAAIAPPAPAVVPADAADPALWLCQPVQAALTSSIEQGLLISQVAHQICQSSDLAMILQTAVDQVRRLLNADRLVIHQFAQPESQPPWALPTTEQGDSNVRSHLDRGYIAYESRATDQISSVLNFVEQECFLSTESCQAKYCSGQVVAVSDTEVTYAAMPCLLDFLRQGQIRAKLIAPIIVQEQLWGLLIAHQCHQPRQWQASEQTFMEHIANHLAIAIGQAQLYAQLQYQTQTLEQRVLERTQSLYDALHSAQIADHAKSEFLATMSHEFRTPLTCVIGMSATLLRWSFGDLSERQRDYLQTIHDSGVRLLEVLNNVLDMSQMEAGRTFLDLQSFSIAGLLSQVIESLKDQVIQQHVQLKVDLKLLPDQDIFMADPRRIRQILYNLLSNAIKFTPAEGTVTVRVRHEPQAVLFQIEDTGIGIAAEQRPLLFQKFQQLDPTRQRSYEGIGLGLALTKQLVDLHGGTLEVTSELGVGSIFTVRIPAPRSQPESLKAAPAPDALLPGQRVLLFEPDEADANIICDMLTAAGMQVVWIVDGSAMADQIDLIAPDILLLDIELPGTDPHDILRLLRSRPDQSQLQIVLITPQGDHPQLAACLQAGANSTLLKPIQPEALIQTMNSLIYPAVVTERS